MLMLFKRTLAVAVFLSVLQSSPAVADYAAGLKAYDGGDFAEALEVWLPLAKEGDAKAQHGVALLYETGRGVPAKDDVEAAKWYAAAALQGIAESQANLALMFAEGRGVGQDYGRAAELWQQAAAKGNTVAHYNLGLLYLNDGVVGGKKLLHPDWVDFCAAATLGSDYAAGFYTNRSDHPNAKGRVQLGFPRDSYFASGLLGQRIVIMPSQRMVVVRLGDSIDPAGDIRGAARLVKEVIAATAR